MHIIIGVAIGAIVVGLLYALLIRWISSEDFYLEMDIIPVIIRWYKATSKFLFSWMFK